MSHISKSKDFHIPIVGCLNGFVQRITKTFAWFNVVLICVIILQVTLRYGFHRGLVPLEELMWHLYCVTFMFGIAYCVTVDSHIRVDLLHANLPKRWQHIFEILGILFLLFPVIYILFDHSLDWWWRSFTKDEGSQNPTGLPNRWIIKSVVPLTMILLFIASVARLIEEWMLLKHFRNWKTARIYFRKESEKVDPSQVSMIAKLFHPQIKKRNNANE